ncbi:uncharacterized protein LOC119602385, partial [Lucilia sericata]|uniref:uncharacterized protein LOC119602385 n=1 Tax=Lucilia sericata TaxID=13632 RepID=UPI0018A8205D
MKLIASTKDHIVISALLNPAGVVKHLKYILSTEVVLEYNIDGVHGKRSLKDLDKFYDVLLESIYNTNLEPAEIQLRKALQLQKKRHFKMVSLNKQVH